MDIFSYSLDDIRRSTAALCSPGDVRRKEENLQLVADSFAGGDEVCAGRPIQLHVEPAAVCSLRCPRCPRGAGLIARRGVLPLTTFKRVLDDLAGPLAGIVFSGWGEPLLNPETPAMIRAAADAGVAGSLNTNGTHLERQAEALLESGLTRLTVALDGVAHSGCHRYTEERPFAAVADGLAAVRRRKDALGVELPRLVGLFVIDEADVADLDRLRRWALAAGAEEVQFKRMHAVMPGERRHRRLPEGDALSLAAAARGAASSERRAWTPQRCAHPWESLFLAATGDVAVCSFDPHLRARLGTAAEGIGGLWNGEALRALRRSHTPGGPPLAEPCASCNRLPGYFSPAEPGSAPAAPVGPSAPRAAS